MLTAQALMATGPTLRSTPSASGAGFARYSPRSSKASVLAAVGSPKDLRTVCKCRFMAGPVQLVGTGFEITACSTTWSVALQTIANRRYNKRQTVCPAVVARLR